jgi:hypothetical protein
VSYNFLRGRGSKLITPILWNLKRILLNKPKNSHSNMSGHVEEFIILNHVGKKIIKKLNEFFYVCIKICIKKKAVIVYKLIYSLKFLQIRKWPFVVWAACRKRKIYLKKILPP